MKSKKLCLGLSLITEALREAKDVFVELDIQSVSGLLELFDKEEKQYAKDFYGC